MLSGQIEFDAKGTQPLIFAGDSPRAAVEGILLAKMRGGQVSLNRRFIRVDARKLILSVGSLVSPGNCRRVAL